MFEQILRWLFVVFSGIAVGAGLYEIRINVPQWFPRSPESGIRINSEAMRTADAGRRFWVSVTTVPLTLLTLVSLPLAWRSGAAGHEWWFAAAAVTLIERVMTVAYFIPTGLKLMHAEALPPAKAAAMALRWVALNYVRAGLAFVGWLAALRALAL